LHVDEVVGGAGLESAHFTGNRYLIRSPAGPVAAAEVLTDNSGAATLLKGINFGPFVEATARGLDRLANLNEVGSASYEARLLRFSAIYLVAIWLKPEAPAGDLLYPLAPAPDPIQAERLYGVGEFLGSARSLAETRTATDGEAVP
jgi:hypothetical protein